MEQKIDTIFDNNQSFPISAIADFLRGISQFGKSGTLHFSTEEKTGCLVFGEGQIQGVHLHEELFQKEFTGKLYRSGIIPENVYFLLTQHDPVLSVEELKKVLLLHKYVPEAELSYYYENMIQEIVFSLLEEKKGEIHFLSHNENSLKNIRSEMSSVFFENDNALLGKYACQFLLDYVESVMLAEELCEGGEQLYLTEESFIGQKHRDKKLEGTVDIATDIFYEKEEQKFISFAQAESSVNEVLHSVCESRKAVFEILIRLKESGTISCRPLPSGASVDDRTKKDTQTHVDSSAQNLSSMKSEIEKKSLFYKINQYLMSPQGIEWILRLLMPVTILAGLYYFQHIVQATLKECSIFFNI